MVERRKSKEGRYLYLCRECHVHFMICDDREGRVLCENCGSKYTVRRMGRRKED